MSANLIISLQMYNKNLFFCGVSVTIKGKARIIFYDREEAVIIFTTTEEEILFLILSSIF